MPDPEEIINTPINPDDYKTPISPKDIGMDDDLDLDDEIDPIGDSALDEFDDEDTGINDEEFDTDLSDLSDDLIGSLDVKPEPEPEKISPEEQIKWSVIEQDNNDIVSKHTDGFILMARPLSAKQKNKIKYISRLSKDGKVLESGVIWIDRNEDARQHLQNIADRILDKGGFVNLSQEKPSKEPTKIDQDDEDDFGDLGLTSPGPDLDFGDEMDFDFGDEEDMDLEGEDIDLEGEEDIDLEV